MKRSWILILLLAASTAPASSGCAYLEARGNDFLDCFKASVAYGLGIESHVQAGPAGFGAGLWVGVSHGIEGRKASGTWSEWDVGIPMLQLMGALGAANHEDGLAPLYFGLSSGLEEVHCHMGNSGCIFYSTANYLLWPYVGVTADRVKITRLYATYSWVDYFWISCSVKFFVGAKLGFNVAEFLDFLLGFAGIDLCGDDDRPERNFKFEDPDAVQEIKEETIDQYDEDEVFDYLISIGALTYGGPGQRGVQVGFVQASGAGQADVVGELQRRGFKARSHPHYGGGWEIVVPLQDFFRARKALFEIRDRFPGVQVWEREAGK